VPAGSVPNDDRWLARHSGAGRNWRKVKTEALRGFTQHADGRLYHHVLVEKALTSWKRKCEQRLRTLKARTAATDKRLQAATTNEDRPHVAAPVSSLRRDQSQALTAPVAGPVADSVTDSVTGGPITHVTATKGEGEGEGQGQGQGQGQGDSIGSYGAGAPPPAGPPPSAPPPAKLASLVLSIKPNAADALPIPVYLDRTPEGEAVRLWNEAARKINAKRGHIEWPEVQALTPSRRTSIKARLSEAGGIEGWKIALSKASSSGWLRGETPRSHGHENWRFNITTMTRQEFFTQLMEGSYDDDSSRRTRRPELGIEAELAGYAKASARR
jgi:hypothetical protein